MKIIEIGSYATGGVTEYTKELGDSLASLGIDVSHFYISNRPKPNMIQKYNPISWLIAWQKIKKTDPDIIHIQYTPTICGPFFPLFLIFLRLVRAKPKLLITAHEKPTGYLCHLNFITKKMFMLYEKMIFKFCDKIIVHTLDHKQELLNRYNIRLNKIAIIPHSITERYEINPIQKEKVIKKYNLNNKNIIAYFGFISPNKGMEYLVNAFPKVLEKKGDLILLIAGIEPKNWRGYINKLKELVKINGVEKYVRITGYIPEDEIPVIFSLSEIIVMPLLITTNSRALHRAVSYNKPVIITDLGNGTVSEIVKQYNIGCVVPPRDSRAIADAILGMLDNPEEMEMFRKNELKVAEELSQKNIAKMHVDLYTAMIQSGCEK